MSNDIPTAAGRTTLSPSVEAFLEQHKSLHLGSHDFLAERRHHLEVFGFHNLPEHLQQPIGKVQFHAVRGRHGTTPIRLFHPSEPVVKTDHGLPALIYFHGGGYTVGSLDEFENGLRIIAENAGVIVIGVEYRLAPEFQFPTQLDEYEDVIAWARGSEASAYGIDGSSVLGSGDSAGGNMTAAISLRLKDEGKTPLKAQLLLYPEARLPFDTRAATENNSGYYLECNGIFSFADHYLPRAPNKAYPPAHRYVSPGMQKVEDLHDLPPAAVFTCGFDPLRDVGVEYASKLQQAGNQVSWLHYPGLTHGFLQMPWSEDAHMATLDVAAAVRKLAFA